MNVRCSRNICIYCRKYLQLVLAFSLFTWRRIDAQPPIIGKHIIGDAFGQHTIDHLLAAAVILLTSVFMWGELTAVLVTGWAEYLPDFCEYLFVVVQYELPKQSFRSSF